MKTIEEIREEYKNHIIKATYVDKLEEFIAYVDDGITKSDIGICGYATLLHQNKKWQVTGFIRNLFPMFFGQEDIDFYDEDNKLLEEGVQLAYTQKGYFQAMKEIATEKNYLKLLCLAELSVEYYNDHIEYIEIERNILDYKYKGYTMSNSRYKDNRKVFHEFFMSEISELAPHKIVEKKIKM